MANNLRIVDGQLDYSGGANSGRVPTIASPSYPNGLRRNQITWCGNATVRDGGVGQRATWQPRVQSAPWSGLYQGGYMYDPPTENPYLVLQIGGVIWQVRVDLDNSVVDLSTLSGPGLTNPTNIAQAFMEQGEQFLVIQAGDSVTNPLFYDGKTLRRSNGFVGLNDPANEIPPATAMEYFMGRLWYANQREYSAGDIVGNQTSGTNVPPTFYDYKDSILHCTENPLSKAGDGFVVPTNAGNIRALKAAANLDTSTGQGRLYIFTREAIYSNQVPVTRADWIAADNNNQPLQTVAQLNYGSAGDRCVVPVNGDLFYQTVEPSIRSLAIAVRFFQQWGNTALARNEQRVLRLNDRNLLRFASGILFNNRLLETSLPFQTDVGVAHKAIVPLNFDTISNFQEQEPPAWEGIWDGLDVLQLFEGDFGGRQRAFAVVVSRLTGEIEVWELTEDERFENGDNRVTWFFETPAYTWDRLFDLKELETLELWFDRLFGTVDFEVYFRPDQHPCWIFWKSFQECAARSCEEDTGFEGVCPPYPTQNYREQYRATKMLPLPPAKCIIETKRPANVAYQFQFLIKITGFCRIRGLMAHALPKMKGPFEGIAC